jgi:hypothetical protein
MPAGGALSRCWCLLGVLLYHLQAVSACSGRECDALSATMLLGFSSSALTLLLQLFVRCHICIYSLMLVVSTCTFMPFLADPSSLWCFFSFQSEA